MKSSEITITDQFCGAGGSSRGAKDAEKDLGLGSGSINIRLALNHWSRAIETHNANFPDTDHDCADISGADPRRYPSTTILITSPECTNHSIAKGQRRKFQKQIDLFGFAKVKPEEERSRATMWDVPRFAEFHDYDIIITENVVDALYWSMFDAWLKAMHLLGYEHHICCLNSRFFPPTPQSRDRMYVVFWKKGNPRPDLEYTPKAFCARCDKQVEAVQSFKNQTIRWGKYKKQYTYRCPGCANEVSPYHYAAFNIIDWSIRGTRISERKKPLASNTLRRIQHGIDKYSNSGFLVNNQFSSGVECRVRGLLEETQTFAGTHQTYLVRPFIIHTDHSNAENDGNRVYDSGAPIRTITTQNSIGVALPFMVENRGWAASRDITEPISTLTSTSVNHGIAFPFGVENFGTSKSRAITEPLSTVTAGGINHGIVTNESLSHFLTYYYSGSDQVSHITEQTGTVTTNDRMALVKGNPDIDDCEYRTLRPHEIKRAMAFRDDYVITGNSKDQVKQAGNAVTPPVMRWLVGQCVKSLM